MSLRINASAPDFAASQSIKQAPRPPLKLNHVEHFEDDDDNDNDSDDVEDISVHGW